MDFYFQAADEGHIKRERAKAKELRRSQWWRQQVGPGLCHYCGEKFPREQLTMDHLIPLARGGRTTKKNVVVSCKECNSKKKYMTPEEVRMEEMNQENGES